VAMSEWKELVRNSRLLRPLRLARLRYIARHSGHEDWALKLRADASNWNELLHSGRSPRVLIATSMGGHFALNAIDRLLAVALTMRGAKVSIGLCDGMLPACQMCELNLLGDQQNLVRNGPQKDICGYCAEPAIEANKSIGLEVNLYSSYLTEEARREAASLARITPLAEIPTLTWRDMPVGEHALAGALRFFARGDLEKESLSEPVLRRYLEASLLMAASIENLVESEKPEIIVAHHGIYVPQGLIAAVARKRGIRLVTWNQAYRAHCFIFSHHETYHRTMMSEPVEVWRDKPLTPEQREFILTYLRSRWHGSADWISFHVTPDLSLTEDIAKLGLDPSRPFALALTNVFWDAQIHYPANAFATQKDWLIDTVRWFAARPHLQLAVRIHPAELSGTPRSRQFAADILREHFPSLPSNIVIIGPESAVSTYDLARSCDTAIIFATKTGIELTSMGIPTIVAGEAWIRGKGLTMDAERTADYFALLEKIPLGRRLDNETTERALRFAFHFFFRRMIPLDFVQAFPGPRRFTTEIDGLADLISGENAGLDTICNGILNGTPFHMEEAAALSFAEAP
jgi:hypothetical protein